MDEHRRFLEMARLERVANALRKNRMQAQVLESREQLLPHLEKLLPKGSTVASGGSMTLEACGVLDWLRGKDYRYLDRFAEGVDAEQVLRESFFADVYLASVGGITENGELYAMDGRANRVAAMAFGPKRVVLVAGHNKIVGSVNEARERNFAVSAPANAHRLHLQTPCASTGKCSQCNSPQRICCTELVLGQQREEGRITVLLVCEDLGY